ncbi:hypothetical protein [Streptomyces sp. NPDC001750]|uniref:hypothetical protein n=1 Tax=Streptomyces sp. NPDC001750 TaxID=3364607 RepID=UPI0036BCA467
MNTTTKTTDLNKLCEVLATAGITPMAPAPGTESHRAHLNGLTWDVNHTGTPDLWILTGPGIKNGIGVLTGDTAAVITSLATIDHT